MASAGLEAFIDEGIRISRQNEYHPTVFIGMRERLGTVPAISQLVELGLLDWTIEAAVTKFPDEFSLYVTDIRFDESGLWFRVTDARPLEGSP